MRTLPSHSVTLWLVSAVLCSTVSGCGGGGTSGGAVDAMPGVGAPPDTSDPPGSTDIDTQLTHIPAAVTASAAVEFSFTSATAGVGFVCRLDNAAFAACSSPVQLTVAEGHHTFAVAAVLGAVQDPTPASFAFTVDQTPPDTMIVSGPTGTVTASEAMFMFGANEPNATFECRLDSAAFAACQSTQSFTGLALGAHSVAVRAIDTAGNPDPSPATATWTVGQVTPQTTIDSTPDPLTRSTLATFAFSSTTAGATFRCAIDGGAAVACNSPKTYDSLVNGNHHFTVQAIAPGGVADPTPASFDWTIDLVPPTVTIDAGPETQSITGGSVSFAFSSPENVPGEAPVVTFECHLDGAAVGLCPSPKDYVGLADGTHLFEVRGVDRAQNRSNFFGRFWTVNNSKPSVLITSPANGSITKGDGMIAFSGSEPGMTFACSLDSAPAAPCTSPVPYAFTTDEQHHVVVTGTGHGMTSEPVSVTWEADGVVPVVTITFPPDDGVTIPGPFVTIEFSSDPGVTFMCSFNGFSFSPCASGDLVGFVDGPNDIRVQATDRGGNVSVARRTFIVDSVGPKVTLKVTPVRASTVTRASGVVTYTSPTATTFDCRAYPTGTTPPDLAPCPVTGFELAPFGFTDGAAVTVDVRGRDQHGILGAIATLNLSIDERPPSITITSPPAMVGRDSVMLFNNPEVAHVICSVETATGDVVIGPFLDCSGLGIHLTVSGDYNGVITAIDSLGNSATYKRPFHVDASLPIAPSDAPRSR